MTIDWKRTAKEVRVRNAEECANLTPTTRLRVDFQNDKPSDWWFVCSGDLKQSLDPAEAREAAMRAALAEAEQVVAVLKAELGGMPETQA